jgi:aryl-alcohol dehydrogenase-like predicted oxidoreductase
VTAPIIGANNLEQLQAVLGAASLRLEASALETLEQASTEEA